MKNKKTLLVIAGVLIVVVAGLLILKPWQNQIDFADTEPNL